MARIAGRAGLRASLARQRPAPSRKAALEAAFNRAAPFRRATALYIVAGLLVAISWLKWRDALTPAGLGVILLTLAVHTAALGVRIHLSGRPPVTNLYSSALFIGWGAVICCLVLEGFFHTGLGLVTGAVIGCLSLMFARGLSGSGDNLAVLQAARSHDRSRPPTARIAQMIYAVVCFATLLSFVGTILGGIWAD